MRAVRRVIRGRATQDGAGVKLRRVFANDLAEELDPFLMLDAFDSTDPKDYVAGFPWHPHRGIETVTYLISGLVEHGDSLGNKGEITSGSCQWMTAGRGIIHQEMPKASEHMLGLQLWVNLPREKKMIPPVYRDLTAKEIVTVSEPGRTVKLLAGEYGGQKGPVEGITIEPTFLDVELEAEAVFHWEPQPEATVFAYVFTGSGRFAPHDANEHGQGDAVLWERDGGIEVRAGANGLRMLVCAGLPLQEPIAWGGPIVMNTRAELQQAFAQLDDGTFLKQG